MCVGGPSHFEFSEQQPIRKQGNGQRRTWCMVSFRFSIDQDLENVVCQTSAEQVALFSGTHNR